MGAAAASRGAIGKMNPVRELANVITGVGLRPRRTLAQVFVGFTAGIQGWRVTAQLLASRLTPLKPSPKRLLRLRRSATREQALNADIFVQFGPMNPFATPDQTPIEPLGGRAVCQPWEPRERRRDRPAIRQVHAQRIIAHSHALG